MPTLAGSADTLGEFRRRGDELLRLEERLPPLLTLSPEWLISPFFTLGNIFMIGVE